MLRRQVSKQDLVMSDDNKSVSFSGGSTPLATPSEEVVFSITPANTNEETTPIITTPPPTISKKGRPDTKRVDRRDSLSLLQHIRLPQQLQVPSQGLK